MAVTPVFLDEIRTRLTLSNIISKRIKLQRKGKEYLGLCPFHNEKTPSFNVVDDKEFYHCFGCGEHGDAFTFVMKTEGLTFMESVQKLAGEVGLDMPVQTKEEQVKQEKRHSLYEVCEQACQFFQTSLYSSIGGEALKYIKGRGISNEILASFRLGYSPDRDGLINHLKSCGVEEKAMVEAGLARRNNRGGLYSFFRNRVMFPITDIRGRVIAFGGRFMGDEKQAKVGKYINSPETLLFDKGRILYNLKNARKSSYDEKRLIVVEGYMDVISLTQAGFPASIAPLGTAMTEDQIIQSWKSFGEPILCFDGDNAGKKAAMSACERVLPMLSAGKSVQISFMPTGLDPDDVIKQQGVGAMNRIINDAIPLVDYLWNAGTEIFNVNTPERLAGLEKHFHDIAFSIADKTVASNYRNVFKNRIWENYKGGNRTLVKGKLKKSGNKAITMTKVLNKIHLPTRRQELALSGLLNHPEVLLNLEERFVGFFDGDLKETFMRACIALSAGFDEIDTFHANLRENGCGDVLDRVLVVKNYQMSRAVKAGENYENTEEFLTHLLDMFVTKMENAQYKEYAKQALLSGKTVQEVESFGIQAKISNGKLYPNDD